MNNNTKTHSNKSTRPLPKPTQAPTPIPPTKRALQATLPIGLIPTPQSKNHAQTHKPSHELLNTIKSAALTHITGHSGSGKSTLLQALQQSIPNTITPKDLPQQTNTLPLTDLIKQPLHQTLSLLSAAGLAEPKLWLRPQSTLSTGEHARLQIALLFSIASPGTTILLDEFCSNLDRLTARSVSSSLRRLVTNTGINIITAAAHEDLPTFLDTDLLINATGHTILPNQYHKEPITIEQGTISDYHALKHHHYIATDPANPCHVLRATRPHPVTNAPTLAAVLVITHPTLNASWRKRAWPNRYNSGNKRADAQRINKELRTIARVITDPRSRSLGLATKLVKHYLNNPLTKATEAIAAMGTISPFFKNAGMTQYPIPHTPQDLRLLDTLHHLNQTPHDLLQINLLQTNLPQTNALQTNSSPSCSSPGLPGEVSAQQTEGVFSSSSSSPLPPLLSRELKTWAQAKNLNPNDPNLPNYAAIKLLTKPCAYTHVQKEYQA